MTGREADIGTFEAFEQCLRDALAHLYDPAYQPPEVLWAVTGRDPTQGSESVQQAIMQAIQNLQPTPQVPSTARVRRIHDVLSYRYIQDLTQEEAAERLGITPRHLRREQQEAVRTLARRLWTMGQQATPAGRPETQPQPAAAALQDAKSPEYRSQVRQELASLQKCAPGTVAHVGETIERALDTSSTLTARHGIQLVAESVRPDLSAAIHPSALRQILISTMGELVQHMSTGRIALSAGRDEEEIHITLTGRPAASAVLPDGNLVRELLDAQGGSVEIATEDDRICFHMRLPSVNQINVLVVDDNMDLVHFYRRYTAETRYHITHAAEAQGVFEAIEASEPDVIVLDVMLPDVDGWELLAQLHEHHATRSIPVVVCSVIREEELALALGATLYLPKPVRRQQFIRALDQAVEQGSTRGRASEPGSVGL